MAKSINSALSVLNETGRELVLQDLSVDPDEKFKGFIDSAGNIDISGLTKMTATIVKAKIEEAEREGIDLRKNASTVFKDSGKTLITESILTVAAIDAMIKNYNNLSYEDRNNLLDHYHEMSDEQRANMDKQIDDRTFELREQLSERAKNDPVMKKILASQDKSIEKRDLYKELYELYKTNKNPQRILEIQKILKDYGYPIPRNPDECLILAEGENKEINNSNDMIRAQEINLKKRDGKPLTSKEIEEEEKLKRDHSNWYDKQGNLDPPKLEEENNIENNAKKIAEEAIEQSSSASNKAFSSQEKTKEEMAKMPSEAGDIEEEDIDEGKTDSIKNEIEQIPIALVKAGFTEEQIKDSLDKYIVTFRNMDKADLNELTTLNPNQLSLTMQTVFSQVGMDEQIAGVLSQITYNKQLFNILEDKNRREQFLDQFESVVNKGITSKDSKKLDGELDTVFSQYFQDNAVDMFVATEKTQTIEEARKLDAILDQQENTSNPQIEEITLDSNNDGHPNIPTNNSDKISETISAEIVDENLPAKVDDSFIGKIKRVIANMKNIKETDSSKGFFDRLKNSVQNVFGNKKKETYAKKEDIADSSNNSGVPKQELSPFDKSLQVTSNELNQNNPINPTQTQKESSQQEKDDEYIQE